MLIRKRVLPLLLAYCVVLLPIWSCTDSKENQDAHNSDVQPLSEKPIVVQDLCKFLNSSSEYDGKLIKLRTTLYKIGPITSVGDSQCIQRHPVIDVDFTSSLKSMVCNSTDLPAELCSLTKDANSHDNDIEIVGTLLVRVHPFVPDSGPSLNGLRFRFIIYEIETIESIMPVESERVKDISKAKGKAR